MPEKENPHRINEQITAPEVRVVGDNVEQPQVMPIRDALRLADEMELDLIEISPKADPPVCRIADYQKFLYQQKKKAKELKANQAKVTVKEIRFGPQTDDHDYNFKLKHAMNFLKEGSKVKAYVFFRGRSIVFKEQGEILLLRFATDLEEVAKVEMMPKLDGKKMNMMLAPKSKSNRTVPQDRLRQPTTAAAAGSGQELRSGAVLPPPAAVPQPGASSVLPGPGFFVSLLRCSGRQTEPSAGSRKPNSGNDRQRHPPHRRRSFVRGRRARNVPPAGRDVPALLRVPPPHRRAAG